jgi:2'-5' RNA ligase
MRVFAALPLPAAALSAVSGVVGVLRARYPLLRYVKPEGMHLTLHFFGELEDQKAEGVKALFADPRLKKPAIHASLGRLGKFPPGGQPRVIWLGLASGEQELKEYSDLFQSLIAPLGHREDPRGFNPHLTLARAGNERVDGEWITSHHVPPLEFDFSECVLFQSVLSRDGAVYSPLARVSLERSAP